MNRLTEQERFEEQISAYLDGELSADETAAVEQLLTQRGDLRQLHDELLAVRASLKALYRHRLDDDFSQRVVRQAERAVLSRPPTEAASENGSAPPGRMPRPFSNVRSWLWAGAAIAAAVLLMINQPRQEGPEGEAGGDGRLAQKNNDDEKIVTLRKAATEPTKTAISAKGRLKEANVDRLAAPQTLRDPRAAGIAAAKNSASPPKTSATVNAADRSRFKGLPLNPDGTVRRSASRPPVARYDFRISRKVADSGAIEKLLARRKIALAATPPGEHTPGGALTSPKPAKPQAATPAGQQFEVIYLQGPPQQVEAVLLALRSQPGIVPTGAPDGKSDSLKRNSVVNEPQDDAANLVRKKTKSLLKRPQDKTAADASEAADALKQGDQKSKSDDLAAGQASTESAIVVGRAWRDAGEARSLAERNSKRSAKFGAARDTVKPAPTGRGGEPNKSAPAVQLGKDVGTKAATTSDAPALVTVKLVFRLIDAEGDDPPAAAEPRD